MARHKCMLSGLQIDGDPCTVMIYFLALSKETRRARNTTPPGLKSLQFLIGSLTIQHSHRCAAKPQVIDDLQMDHMHRSLFKNPHLMSTQIARQWWVASVACVHMLLAARLCHLQLHLGNSPCQKRP